MVLLKMFIVLALIVILMRKRISLGNSMFAGAATLWLLMAPNGGTAWIAVSSTFKRWSTWEVMLAMYFVMALEHLLRTQGILDGFMASIRQILKSDRILLAFMPAFLGFLPSMGGALFSAPMVENAARPYSLSPEDKTAINYWFRHIWEFSNPIVPALLVASEITSVPVSVLITHLSGFTVLAAVIGWLLLLSGRKYLPLPDFGQPGEGSVHGKATPTQAAVFFSETVTAPEPMATQEGVGPLKSWAGIGDLIDGRTAGIHRAWYYILLAAGPISANIFLVVFFHLSAALSMGLVVTAMVFILRLKPSGVWTMLQHAFDRKLLWGIFSILLFQETLEATGMINEIVALLRSSGVPVFLMVGIMALLIGMLTGQLQGFVAVSFPMITALSPGNLSLIVTGYVMGVVGTMLSPAHLCLVVTVEYFKANFVRTLRPIAAMSAALTVALIALNFLT